LVTEARVIITREKNFLPTSYSARGAHSRTRRETTKNGNRLEEGGEEDLIFVFFFFSQHKQ
jgi:hypothetical protein